MGEGAVEAQREAQEVFCCHHHYREGLTIHSLKENSRLGLGTKAIRNISGSGADPGSQHPCGGCDTVTGDTLCLWCWELPTTWTFNTSICTSG